MASPDDSVRAAVSAANATWALFWVTLALVLVGAAAAVAAYRAYLEQSRVTRLEADPVLYLAPAESVATDVRLEDIVRLRPSGTKAAAIELVGYSVGASRENPPKAAVVLELRNLGRSPAVAVEIDITLSTYLSARERVSAKGKLHARAIHALGSVFFEIQTDLQASLEIEFSRRASCLNYWSSKEKRLTIPALGIPLIIAGLDPSKHGEI